MHEESAQEFSVEFLEFICEWNYLKIKKILHTRGKKVMI